MSSTEFKSLTCQSVGILMVATNNYIERWKDTAIDLEQNAFKDIPNVVIHLFTNQVVEAQEFGTSRLFRIKLVIHEIKGWGWPEATLWRYKFFQESKDLIREDFLMYLDSDMRVVGEIAIPIAKHSPESGIGVVRHPGFYRPKGINIVKFYLNSPIRLIKDLKLAIKSSIHLGAWEINRISTAFVPRNRRKNYVHGAIWFGYRAHFFEMCEVLSQRVTRDQDLRYIAKWHDESHLNWFITNYQHRIYDNNLSWVENYDNLFEFSESFLVSNVQKSIGEGRTPSNV